jgi:hypothetical protein
MIAHKFFPIPGKIVDGKFLSIANPPEGHTQEIPLCETDYFRRLELLCHTCGLALRGSYITEFDRKYHPEHFNCMEPGCVVNPSTTERYYEHEGAKFCKYHYGQRAKICHGCGTAIFHLFHKFSSSGQNQTWHPKCCECPNF